MARLMDDGTLDTVVKCDDCGEEARYTFMPSSDEETYTDFVKWCLEDFEETHECLEEEHEEPYDDEDPLNPEDEEDE